VVVVVEGLWAAEERSAATIVRREEVVSLPPMLRLLARESLEGVALEDVVSVAPHEGCVAGSSSFRSPFPSVSVTASSPPERSPLEPVSKYGRRKRKWRTDNAKWAGQRRAVRKLSPPKPTPIPKRLDEK